MRWNMLILASSWCSLGYCGVLPVHNSIETVQLFGDADVTHAQTLYDLMAGTFVLPYKGLNGQDVIISGIHMFKEHPNATFATDQPTVDEKGLEIRAPFDVDSYLCAHPPTNLDRVLTHEQQLYIAGKFCTFVASVQPSSWAVVGLTASNLHCGSFAQPGKLICQGIYTISGAEAGRFLGPGIQSACASSLAQLRAECGVNGGQQIVTVPGEGKYIEEAFATQEKGTDCVPQSGTGASKCTTITCTNQCQ